MMNFVLYCHFQKLINFFTCNVLLLQELLRRNELKILEKRMSGFADKNGKPTVSEKETSPVIQAAQPRPIGKFFYLCTVSLRKGNAPINSPSTWWYGLRLRLGWVEMAVGLPEGPSYPRHSSSFFRYAAP